MDYVEHAITLGIKKQFRSEIDRYDLTERLYNMFKDYYTVKYVLFSLEEYTDTGLHVHIYYLGSHITWKIFNQQWGLGYVKNRKVYDRGGWIRYIKKHGDFHEIGKDPELGEDNRTILEKMTGMSAQQASRMNKELGNRSTGEGLFYVSDEEDNLPF